MGGDIGEINDEASNWLETDHQAVVATHAHSTPTEVGYKKKFWPSLLSSSHVASDVGLTIIISGPRIQRFN